MSLLFDPADLNQSTTIKKREFQVVKIKFERHPYNLFNNVLLADYLPFSNFAAYIFGHF